MKLLWLMVSAIISSFAFSVKAQDGTGSVYNGCNHTILEGQGVILSPNFPGAYDPDSNCWWQITVERDRTIFLTFKHFNVESSPNCAYDSLSIYNGPTTLHPMLGKFCGAFKPSDLTATSNRMLMQLKSDDSTQKNGFMAIFFSVSPGVATPNSCGGVLTDDEGSFNSVNFPKSPYPNSMTCTWHMRTVPGRSIRLTFLKMTLELSDRCKYDAVTVVGGWSNSDETRFLGRFCKISDIPHTIDSIGNEMYVIFSTDSSGNDDGFMARYSTVEIPTTTVTSPPVKKTAKPTDPSNSICGSTTVLTSHHGIFSSPGYKRTAHYDPNLRCSWRIALPPNSRIVVTFTNFALEEDPGCIFDYVAVYSGSEELDTPMARYCGSMQNAVLESLTNELFIVFVTDSGGSAAGFRAEYRSVLPTTTEIPTEAPTTTLPTTTTRATFAMTSPTSPPSTTARPTAPQSTSTVQTAGCPTDCVSQDLAEAACTSSYVLLFKLLKVRESRKDESARIFVSLLKNYKVGRMTAGKRRGSRFWLDVPCTSCLPPLARRSRYFLAGSAVAAVVDPNDFMESYRRNLVPFMRKAIRRCRPRKPKKKKRKRGKKHATKKKKRRQ